MIEAELREAMAGQAATSSPSADQAPLQGFDAFCAFLLGLVLLDRWAVI